MTWRKPAHVTDYLKGMPDLGALLTRLVPDGLAISLITAGHLNVALICSRLHFRSMPDYDEIIGQTSGEVR